MKWKNVRHRLILILAPTLGVWFLKFVLGSLRMKVFGRENLERVQLGHGSGIFCFWHSRILYMLAAEKGSLKVHTMVSMNRDGEYISLVAGKFGHQTVRGSSSRGGGKALLTMTRLLKSGESVAFTPDGPRGPREVFQPGAVHLSLSTGYPIVPVAYNVKRKKVFGSWDGFILPCPFTSGVMVIGEPVEPCRFVDRENSVEEMRQAAEEALKKVTARADREVS